MDRVPGLWRQLLLPSQPGASLLLVLLLGGLPALFNGHVPGALFGWVHAAAAILLTAAMILGLMPGQARRALRVSVFGAVVALIALCIFATVAGRLYGGRTIAMACAILLTIWAVQIAGWWLDEADAAPHSPPRRA